MLPETCPGTGCETLVTRYRQPSRPAAAIDVKLLLAAADLLRTTRVISVNHREIPAGLVVDEVLGFEIHGS